VEDQFGLAAAVNEVDKLEAELLAAEDASDEACQAKVAFLANLNHELRTPLNAIIGMSSLLLMDSNLTREQRDYVETISDSGEMLLAHITNLLDLSKMEKGLLRLANQPFSLKLCIKEAMDMAADAASEKRLSLSCYADESLPENVVADPRRLRQILANLLDNAIKFTKEGKILVSVYPHDGNIHFAVRDTGIGLPERVSEHLFKPFYQADASLTRKYEGMGMGLALCKRLVFLMGGQIWAESNDDCGSTFHFLIPMRSGSDQLLSEMPLECEGGYEDRHRIAAPCSDSGAASRGI